MASLFPASTDSGVLLQKKSALISSTPYTRCNSLNAKKGIKDANTTSELASSSWVPFSKNAVSPP